MTMSRQPNEAIGDTSDYESPLDVVAAAAAATIGGKRNAGRFFNVQEQREFRRYVPNRRKGDQAPAADNNLSPLEARRLMSVSAGSVEFAGDTLSLDPNQISAAGMAVELDLDGSHLRGVMVGPNGERTEGDWVNVERVRRITVSGTEGVDNVRLDSRLTKTRPEVNVTSDVERVQVFHETEGFSGRRGRFDAFRLARQIGQNHVGVKVETSAGRISKVDVKSGFADLRVQSVTVLADGQSISVANGGTLDVDAINNGGIVVDVDRFSRLRV